MAQERAKRLPKPKIASKARTVLNWATAFMRLWAKKENFNWAALKLLAVV